MKVTLIASFMILSFMQTSYSSKNDLAQLLKTKKNNYSQVLNSYIDLEDSLRKRDINKFCLSVVNLKQSFYEVYAEDMKLAWSLVSFNNQDFLNYANHIDENSKSDIFNLNYFQNLCEKNRALDALKSFSGIYMNQSFLRMTHSIWMESFCPEIPGNCY